MRDDERNPKTAAGVTPGTAALEHEVHDANRDPVTGEPGAHPVGTGVGAATGGTVGAVIGGAVGGPIGAMVGAAVGGIAGGLAGKGISESVNPTEEDAFWRDHYSTRPYASGRKYEDLQPAYRYGWEARTRHENRNWNDVEGDLERDWSQRHGTTGLAWNDARNATRDAWNRVDARHRFNTSEDDYWRNSYSSRPYSQGKKYEDLQPAYRYGYESRHLNRDRDWNSAENDLERGWEKAKANTRHGWHEVKDAVRDGWDRVTDPNDLDNSRRDDRADVGNTTGYAGTSFTGAHNPAGAVASGMATHELGTKGLSEGPTSTTGTTLSSPAGSHLTGSGGTMTAGSIGTGTAATGLAGGTPSTITGWTHEDSYWRNNYSSRPYASGRTYDDLSPAYRYGYDSANQYRGRSWNEVETDLERGWDRAKGASRSTWQDIKDAVRDAWHRVERAAPGDADRDGR